MLVGRSRLRSVRFWLRRSKDCKEHLPVPPPLHSLHDDCSERCRFSQARRRQSLISANHPDQTYQLTNTERLRKLANSFLKNGCLHQSPQSIWGSLASVVPLCATATFRYALLCQILHSNSP